MHLLKLLSWNSASLKMFIFLKTTIPGTCSGSASLNYFNNFIKNMINHSESAVSLKMFIFLKNNLIQDTSREARIVSAPAALICPNDTRGKDPWSFSPRGSPFSLRNHRRTQKTHAIRNDKRRRKHRFH